MMTHRRLVAFATATLFVATACGGADQAPNTPDQPDVAPELTTADDLNRTPAVLEKPAEPPPTTAPKTPSAPRTAAKPTPPAPPAPITSVSVKLVNECSDEVRYCVHDGSTLRTFLNSSTSTYKRMSVGAEVMLEVDGDCKKIIFTATPQDDNKVVLLCER